MMQYDAFISHAHEDKEEIAKPLADALSDLGYAVWYDDYTLKVGDSLRRSLDKGLASCRYGIVVLSNRFFEKKWANYELDGLVIRERNGEKVILPIWHQITSDDIAQYSLTLADRIAATTESGVDNVVARLVEVLGHPIDQKGQKRSAVKRRLALENSNRKNQYTIDLYNEWHSTALRDSRIFVSAWTKKLYEQNIGLPSLTRIEDEGGETEYYVFHVIHYFEKWATMSQNNVIDGTLLRKMLGSYVDWYETNLIDPLMRADERNRDFKNLLNLTKHEIFDV